MIAVRGRVGAPLHTYPHQLFVRIGPCVDDNTLPDLNVFLGSLRIVVAECGCGIYQHRNRGVLDGVPP